MSLFGHLHCKSHVVTCKSLTLITSFTLISPRVQPCSFRSSHTVHYITIFNNESWNCTLSLWINFQTRKNWSRHIRSREGSKNIIRYFFILLFTHCFLHRYCKRHAIIYTGKSYTLVSYFALISPRVLLYFFLYEVTLFLIL